MDVMNTVRETVRQLSKVDFRRTAPLLEEASSETCSCCGRSKQRGSLFAIMPDSTLRSEHYDYNGYVYKFGGWETGFEAFPMAANQGCQRCSFVFLACLANVRSMDGVFYSEDIIRVENDNSRL